MLPRSHLPFYDPKKSYEENFKNGPFGIFKEKMSRFNLDIGKPKFDFLGFKVNAPFGIPAGPLINSNFCRCAFANNFDVCVYKTVRSAIFPCHSFLMYYLSK